MGLWTPRGSPATLGLHKLEKHTPHFEKEPDFFSVEVTVEIEISPLGGRGDDSPTSGDG